MKTRIIRVTVQTVITLTRDEDDFDFNDSFSLEEVIDENYSDSIGDYIFKEISREEVIE